MPFLFAPACSSAAGAVETADTWAQLLLYMYLLVVVLVVCYVARGGSGRSGGICLADR